MIIKDSEISQNNLNIYDCQGVSKINSPITDNVISNTQDVYEYFIFNKHLDNCLKNKMWVSKNGQVRSWDTMEIKHLINVIKVVLRFKDSKEKIELLKGLLDYISKRIGNL